MLQATIRFDFIVGNPREGLHIRFVFVGILGLKNNSCLSRLGPSHTCDENLTNRKSVLGERSMTLLSSHEVNIVFIAQKHKL